MKKFCILASILMLTGCVYPFSVDLEDISDASLVVDANILIGNPSTIRLSYLQSLQVGQESTAVGRPSAEIYLEDSAGNRYAASGSYGNYTIPSFEVAGSGNYRLTIVCNGKTYHSVWIEPVEPPTITDVSFAADESNVYIRLSMEDNGKGSGYAAASVDEIWNFHADFIRQLYYNPDENKVSVLINSDDSRFWCWKKNNSNSQNIIDYSTLNGKVSNYTINTFGRTNNRNHREYHAKVKLWNLTPEQYEYRKMLEENASIGGNLFSPEPGEIRGNIFCEEDRNAKVYGYVNISKVAVKEVSLDERYNRWRTPFNSLQEVEEELWPDMYNLGYSPVDFITNSDNVSVPGWGLARCYDCVEAGGTLEKPEFDL